MTTSESVQLYRITVERRQEDTQLIYASSKQEAYSIARRLNLDEPAWDTVESDVHGWSVNFPEMWKGEAAFHPDKGWIDVP